KVRALKDIARQTLKGVVPTRRACSRLSDDEIIERLTQIHGVGRWTVEMLLIFTLGRPDVLPVDDFGVREGFRVAYGRRTPPTRPARCADQERIPEPILSQSLDMDPPLCQPARAVRTSGESRRQVSGCRKKPARTASPSALLRSRLSSSGASLLCGAKTCRPSSPTRPWY